jgi:hypothetical protein
LFVVGCGSDQTGFKSSDDGGPGNKGGPDAGLSTGGSGANGSGGATSTGGGTNNSGGAGNAAGNTSQGGSGAMSMAGSTGNGGKTTSVPDSGAEPPDAASGGNGGSGGGAGNPDSGQVDSGSGGCPAGSKLVNGKCLKDNLQTCTKGTECGSGNCVGGACCQVACNSPGPCEKLDGTVCQNGNTCIYGPQMDGTVDPTCPTDKCSKPSTCFNGACSKGMAVDCSDANQCTVDACNPATGCSHTPIDVTAPGNTCDDNNVCTTDTCAPAVGCQHTNSNGVKAGCNDNNPCTTDICSGGNCMSTPLDCSGLTDDCNTGVCTGGTCKAQPANVNGTCDNGLTTCDAGGKCSAAGKCVSTGNACGALSTACTPCTTGATCSNDRLCTCAQAAPTDVVVGGVCVVNTDDCATNPCGAQGTACHDPTPNGSTKGDFTCTCAKGYSQKTPGTACTDVNECTPGPNPCLAGTCTNTVGSYDCTCVAPLTKIQTTAGPQCACNLGGTYALVANTMVSYPPIPNPLNPNGAPAIEGSPAAGLPNVAWALRLNTVNAANGTLTSQTVSCGGSTSDLCDNEFSVAHAQYEPAAVFGQPAMVASFPTITTPLSGVIPGGSYTEPSLVAVSGIQLDSNTGAWPACAECVGTNHAAGTMCTCPGGQAFQITNGAQWLNNPDGFGQPGFTTFAAPAGGLATTSAGSSFAPTPPYNLVDPTVCPRMGSNPATYHYAPIPDVPRGGGFPFLAYAFHAASRLQSVFKVDPKVAGQSVGAQCTLAGGITGPDNGHAKTEARVEGCEVCTATNAAGLCTGTNKCSVTQSDAFDEVAQNQQIVSATFTLQPAPAAVNLATILAMPAGAAKVTAINNACAAVRTAYPPPRK